MVKTLLLMADWVKEEEATGHVSMEEEPGGRRKQRGTLKDRGNANHPDYFPSPLIKAPNANCSIFSNHTCTFLPVIFLDVDCESIRSCLFTSSHLPTKLAPPPKVTSAFIPTFPINSPPSGEVLLLSLCVSLHHKEPTFSSHTHIHTHLYSF